jgi:hypothetical protein
MRFVTITTITTGLSICFIEANPAEAAIITVPFNWELQNNGLSYARSVVYNNGSGNPPTDSQILTSLITVIANHQAPPNARRLDPLPQTTSLNVTGSFIGELGGTCLAIISYFTRFDCYSKATASLTSPVIFTPPEQVWQNAGVFPFNIPLNDTLNVAAGNYPITGTVNVSTLLGLLILGSEVYGDANLFVSSRFSPGVQTTFDIRYETDEYQSIPEPLTMFGAAAALGYGALLKRQSSKNKKS